MRNIHGFTIIEILVVITVIAILGTTSIITYGNVQKQSRDTERVASATIVTESLEKYFAKNGEYPSVAKMTATDATSVKQLLGLANLDSLVAPNAPLGSTTSMWKAGNASSTNRATYTGGPTDASPSCLTGNTATDACDDFKVQYYEEETSTIKTILSRSTATGPPAAPAAPVIAAPAAPTITADISGTNAVGTRTSTNCNVGAKTFYSFRSRTNDGAWSAFTAWNETATTVSLAAAQGSKYGFQVKAKCLEGDYSSADSTISAEATYIRPISTPSITALTNSSTGTTTTWSWPAVACPAGTTTYYGINRGTDYDTTGAIGWLGYTADQTTTTYARDTTSQGYEYTAVIRAKCGTAYYTSGWSAESNYSKYIRPVAAPGGASGWSYAVINGRAQYRWAWAEPACGQATARQWQWDGYVGDVNNANGWNMYWTDKGPYNHYWYGATAPSFQDNGWYTGNILDLDLRGTSTPGGIDVYARIKYRCINPATQRNAQGAWIQSPQYFT